MREGIQKRHFQNKAIPNQNQNQNQGEARGSRPSPRRSLGFTGYRCGAAQVEGERLGLKKGSYLLRALRAHIADPAIPSGIWSLHYIGLPTTVAWPIGLYAVGNNCRNRNRIASRACTSGVTTSIFDHLLAQSVQSGRDSAPDTLY